MVLPGGDDAAKDYAGKKWCVPVAIIFFWATALALHAGTLIVTDRFEAFTAGSSPAGAQLQRSDPRVIWQHFGPGLSGYIDKFWIHPTDPASLFMSLDMGNSHGTWNRGESWKTIKDHDGTGQGLSTIQSVGFAHQNPDIGLALAQEGIYITSDRGRSWEFLTDPDPSGNRKHSVMTVDPNNDQVWYIGAGQHWMIKNTHFNRNGLTYSGEANHSAGFILKSVDRGEQWVKITTGLPPDADFSKLIVDPRDSERIYASCQHGVFRSDNAGLTWQKTPGSGLPNHVPRDMEQFHDTETGEFILYLVEVTEYIPDGDTIRTEGGVYRSKDGAETWENLTGNLGINLQQINNQQYRDKYYRAVAYWLEMDTVSARETYPVLPTNTLSQFIRIGVDPQEKDRICLTHNFKHDFSFPPGNIWMTHNSGTNWIAAARDGVYWENESDKEYWISRDNPLGVNVTYSHVQKEHSGQDNMGAGPRFLSVDNTGQIYTAFAQQLIRSTDRGATWVQIDDDETSPGSGHWVGRGGSNLPGQAICTETGRQGIYLFGTGEHGLWQNTTDGDLVYPGAIAVKQLAGQSTSRDDALSISAIAVHPQDPNKIYTLQFRQTQRHKLRFSPDGGASWQTLSQPVEQPFPEEHTIADHVQQYSLLIDPDNPDNLYFCVPVSYRAFWGHTGQWRPNGPEGVFFGHGIYKSTDGGLSWTQPNDGIPPGKSVFQLILDPDDPNTLYAALNQTHTLEPGGLYKSTDGAESWHPIPIPDGILSVNEIFLNKTAGDLYIACGTFLNDGSPGGLWVSRDRGGTWEKIFDMPNVIGVTGSPADPDLIAVRVGQARAVDLMNPGVYVTLDGGAYWVKINTGLGQPNRVTALVADPVDENVLWCALFGTGFWRADLFYLRNPPVTERIRVRQDADVKSSEPDNVFGRLAQLKLNVSPARYAYVQFEVAGLRGPVSKAYLWVRNHLTTPVYGTLSVFEASNGWNETNVTWNLKNDMGRLLSSRRLITAGEWYALDLSDLITGDGLYTAGLQIDSSTEGFLYSKEHPDGSNAPWLEIKTIFDEPFNAWMAHHRLSDPDGDRDGDGLSAREEFISGTNPLDPASCFRAQMSSGAFTQKLLFSSQTGRIYSVEFTPDLTEPWTPADEDISGTGFPVEREIPRAHPAGFYRIRVQFPQ